MKTHFPKIIPNRDRRLLEDASPTLAEIAGQIESSRRRQNECRDAERALIRQYAAETALLWVGVRMMSPFDDAKVAKTDVLAVSPAQENRILTFCLRPDKEKKITWMVRHDHGLGDSMAFCLPLDSTLSVIVDKSGVTDEPPQLVVFGCFGSKGEAEAWVQS